MHEYIILHIGVCLCPVPVKKTKNHLVELSVVVQQDDFLFLKEPTILLHTILTQNIILFLLCRFISCIGLTIFQPLAQLM